MKFNRKKILKYSFILIAFIAILVFIDKVAMFWYVGRTEIKVDNVIGKKYEEGELILKNSGLNPVLGGSKFDSKHPPGTIISQRPEANSLVKKDRRIYLIISSGEETVEVPNLREKTIREASITLNRIGLLLGDVKEDSSSEVQKGLVMGQSLTPGRKVTRGIKIDVIISSGAYQGEIEVPNLIGKSLSESEKILGSNGLKIGTLNYQINNEKLPNTILDQFPRSGEKIKPGESIDLFISKEILKKE